MASLTLTGCVLICRDLFTHLILRQEEGESGRVLRSAWHAFWVLEYTWMKRLLFGGCLENSKVEKLSGVVWSNGGGQWQAGGTFNFQFDKNRGVFSGLIEHLKRATGLKIFEPGGGGSLPRWEAPSSWKLEEYLLVAGDERWGVARGQVVIVLLAWGHCR